MAARDFRWLCRIKQIRLLDGYFVATAASYAAGRACKLFQGSFFSAVMWPRNLFASVDATGPTVDIHTSSCTPLVQLGSNLGVPNHSRDTHIIVCLQLACQSRTPPFATANFLLCEKVRRAAPWQPGCKGGTGAAAAPTQVGGGRQTAAAVVLTRVRRRLAPRRLRRRGMTTVPRSGRDRKSAARARCREWRCGPAEGRAPWMRPRGRCRERGRSAAQGASQFTQLQGDRDACG